MVLEHSLLNIRKLDTLSLQSSPIHKLDPRSKLITTLGFIITVISFPRYELAQLLPFLLYPLFLLYGGNIPLGYLLKKVAIVSPFALFIAIWGPLTDHEVVFRLFSLPVSAGIISFSSIMLRFLLTVLATLVLIAGTGFIPLCYALIRLKVPTVLATQLLFLYRYLYVLVEEALRMVRAEHIRSLRNKMRFGTFKHILGSLLLRTIDRAERIHAAMMCRGFAGTFRVKKTAAFKTADLFFIVGWVGFFVSARIYNLPLILGNLIMGATA